MPTTAIWARRRRPARCCFQVARDDGRRSRFVRRPVIDDQEVDVVENDGRECVPEAHIVLQVAHVAVVAVADGQPLARAPADGADLVEARGAGRVPRQARAAGGVERSRRVERQDDRGRAATGTSFARCCCGGQPAKDGEKQEGACVHQLFTTPSSARYSRAAPKRSPRLVQYLGSKTRRQRFGLKFSAVGLPPACGGAQQWSWCSLCWQRLPQRRRRPPARSLRRPTTQQRPAVQA